MDADSDAEKQCLCPRCGRLKLASEVIDSWSMLAGPVRAGIHAIVRAVRSGGAHR